MPRGLEAPDAVPQVPEDVPARTPLAPFHRVHQLHNAPVDRGLDAVLAPAVHYRAVYDVHLGLQATLEVLEHRGLGGAGVSHRDPDGLLHAPAVFGATQDEYSCLHAEDLLERQPLGHPDLIALAPEGEGHLASFRVFHHLAVEQARDRPEAREGAVHEQLGPDLAPDVLRKAHVFDGAQDFRQPVGPVLSRAVGLPDHERGAGRLGQLPWSEVRGAPLDGAPDEVPGPDDAGDALLHEAVAEGDVGLGQPPPGAGAGPPAPASLPPPPTMPGPAPPPPPPPGHLRRRYAADGPRADD